MSNVTFISLALFLETLTAVLAFMAFCALSREYFRRRQRHLLFFALAFLSLTASYSAIFLGQVLQGLGNTTFAGTLIISYQYGTAIQSLFLLFGIAELYAPKGRRLAMFMLAAILPLVSLASVILSPQRTIDIYGYSIPWLTTTQYVLNFAAFGVAAVAMIFSSAMRGQQGSPRTAGPERWFVFAGFVLLGVFVTRLFGVYFDEYWTLPIASFIQTFFIVAASMAAIAKGNPDPVIAAQPSMYIKKRMLYKAAGFNALLFWFLSFFLVFVTSSYFISASVDARRTGLRKDVHFFSKSFAASGVQFLGETTSLAALPSLPSVIGADPSTVPPAVNDFVRKDGRQRIVRIVDKDGIIVFSSFSQDELGTSLDSAVMRKALAGRKVAATEHEDSVSIWALRAAVPLEFGDGTIGGVVLTTDLGAALDFSDYTSISPVLASGYGYVTETGAVAFSSGETMDEVTKAQSRKALGTKTNVLATLSSADEIHLEHTYASDGSPNGFFYAIVREAFVANYAFRIMAVVMLVMHLALAAIVAVLIFVMSMVLRPIRDMRAATSRVGHGDYDVHVEYQSPDELGELATAFNRMSGAIAERTERLRQAVREQQDFLEHSVRDMRTPINIFRWTLELMRFGDTGRLNRQQLEFLEQLHQTNERLSHMVQNLQDVSRLDQGKYPSTSEQFSIEDVLDEVAGELAVQIRERNILLHWKRPETPLPLARADRAATKKIVRNLLSNAVKYNQLNGHIELIAAPAARSGPEGMPGSFLQLTIEDSGRGIPAGERGRVFSRFFRSRSVVGEEIEGAGLGLHIAKKLVELQKGSIWFTSNEGEGTTFNVTIPAVPKR